MAASLIYSNIHLYRLAMNALYRGKYTRRFEPLVAQIGRARSVCELCFGDTFIAQWCRRSGVDWTGVDLNGGFCARARRLGFRVVEGDLLAIDLPDADVFLMAGSLYHFHDRLGELFERVWTHTNRFVVSEPVRNLSAERGLVGLLARRSADPGNGPAAFRFDQETLRAAIRQAQQRVAFTATTTAVDRDMVVVMQRLLPFVDPLVGSGKASL